jgi:hypothetical protein
MGKSTEVCCLVAQRQGKLWKTGRDYPDQSAANQQKRLTAAGIPAIASSPPILGVHAEPAG